VTEDNDLIPLLIERIGDFPMDDHDRTSGEYAEPAAHRHILDAAVIEPQDDSRDQFVTMPLRAVLDLGGPRVEFGRYSLPPDEAREFAQALTALAAQLDSAGDDRDPMEAI
jgi:hypothetical protein